MHYEYSDRDLLESPRNYMYPQYAGMEFLRAWQSNRLKRLEEVIPLCSPDAPRVKVVAYLQSQEFAPSVNDFAFHMRILDRVEESDTDDSMWDETEAELKWTADNLNTVFIGKARKTIEGLIRRFEISKKIPRTLIPPNYSLDSSPLLSAGPYALFAGILAYRQAIRPSIAELNCLLKVNDLLISQSISMPSMRQLTTGHYESMALGIAGELSAVVLLFGENLNAVV